MGKRCNNKRLELKYGSIIITGSLSWDVIMDYPKRFVDQLAPDKLHQLNISFVVDRLEKQLGGIAANIAYAASQYLRTTTGEITPEVRVLGGLGKDGAEHLRFFRKNRIDTRGIIRDKRLYCSTGTVITDKTDNQIWGYYYGASIRGKDVDCRKYVNKDSLMIISATHPEALLSFQAFAVKHRIPYLYDVGMSLSWIADKDLEEGVRHCRYLIGNDYEIAMILKRIGKRAADLNAMGVAVITTLGAQGVRYEDGKHNITVPAYAAADVTDPTGAGDAWRGGFMSAISMGCSIPEALKTGNATASFAIEHYGTVSYTMPKGELKKRLKSL